MHALRIGLCLYSILVCSTTIQSSPFKKIKAFFGATPFEQTVNKDYPLTANGTVIIKNLSGTVHVQPGLDKQSVTVQATSCAGVEEHLDHVHIIEETVLPDMLVLRTSHDYTPIKGHTDYRVTVPASARVQIFNDHGNVSAQDVQGDMLINIGNGNCTMYAPEGKNEVNVTQQGDITVIRPTEATQLSSNKGTVRVVDSSCSVAARTKKGKLEVKCKSIPENGFLKLATQDGPITLHTPQQLCCSIRAETEKGVVTGTQEITLDPITVTLDEEFWNHLKRSVKGAIGSSEPLAQIKLFSKTGDIKILKY